MNMKKLLMVGMAVLFVLAGADTVFAEEYKIFYSGVWEGTITVTKDTKGKITIIPRVDNETWRDTLWAGIDLIHSQCPLVPEGKEFSVSSGTKEIVIDGNTTTDTGSLGSHWEKTAVNGNTTTTTYSSGRWGETVIDGNTTITTYSDGIWWKTVIAGNTTTRTNSEGWWSKTVVDGNTTTFTESSGRWRKTVVDGNTTIVTSNYFSAQMTVVDKQGYNIYIYTTTSVDSYNSGVRHYNQKNYDQAIADYTNAIRIDPDDARWYRSRGSAYSAQKNYDQAIADYTQAIRLDPSANSYSSRGKVYSDKGDYDRAIADFTEAIRLNPQDDYAYSMRGYVYAKKKDYRNAIPDYEAALRINPNLTSTRNNLESARKQVR